MTLIFEDKFVEVFFRDGPDERTLVTFNGLGVYADGKRYWAQGVAERLELRCVGVISRAETWFPSTSMRCALAAITPLLKGRVTTYGSSMGAYAALKYSAALGADTVLAFSPQSTISPMDLPGNPYAQYYRDDIHHDMLVRNKDLSGTAYVFSDTHHVDDIKQIALIPDQSSIDVVPVPYLRHDTNAIVNNIKVISRLFDLALSRDGQGIRSLIRSAKRLSPMTYVNVGMCLSVHRKFLWAKSSLARAQELGLPGAKAAQFYLENATALEKATRHEEALDSFRMAVLSHSTNAGIHRVYINALIKSNRMELAQQSVHDALQHCPENRDLLAVKDIIGSRRRPVDYERKTPCASSQSHDASH